MPKLLGVSKGEGDFFGQLWHLITHPGQAQGLTVAVGLASLRAWARSLMRMSAWM